MFDRAAIVLAAGLSRRMGDANKLLLPLGGQPLLRHGVSACIEACDAPVTVVTGHDSAAVAAALDGLLVNLVHNPDFAQGQVTSIATGLRAVPEARATLVALADQPLLDAAALGWLFEAFAEAGGEKITVPLQGETRGNPIVIPHALMPDLLTDRQNPGCRKFIRDNPELVHWALTDNPAFFTDVDLPEDYDRLRQQFTHAAPGPLTAFLQRINPFRPLTDAEARLLAGVKFPCC